MKYLKPKQHYIDLYDRVTVDLCRRIEKRQKEHEPSPYKGSKEDQQRADGIVAWINWLELLFETGERWHKKNPIIEEWVRRDQALDDLMDSAQPPEDVRCLTCRSLTKVTSKDIHSEGIDGDSRVFFMFECPKGCLPHRAFFHDGEEWKSKPTLCPKCRSAMDRDMKREGQTVTTTDTCSHCGHVEKESHTFSSSKKEKIDKHYVRDRDRFCISDTEGQKYLETRIQMENMKKLVERMEEVVGHQKDYDAVAKLKKLTIVELENLLAPLCEKAGYIKLSFDAPDMGRDLLVSFSAHDSKSERRDKASEYNLQQIIKKGLADTNWRLMSDGISYRLGILTGRLRAYEREEDLLKLVK